MNNSTLPFRNRILKMLMIPASSIFLLMGCDENNPIITPVENDIVDYLNNSANHTILSQLIDESSLKNTLTGNIDYTIFAPTDAAFDNLPQGFFNGLNNTQKLQILRYHVLNGEVNINTESYNETRESIQGDPLFITVESSNGTLNNSATVTTKNQTVSNGIVHEIDHVLLPDAFGTIGENIKKRYSLNTLANHLEELEVFELLGNEGYLTFIIPPFNVYNDLEEWLEKSLTTEQKIEIWKYNIISEDISGIAVGAQLAIQSEMGDTLFVSMEQTGQHLFNQYITTNQLATVVHSSNGAIYFADGMPITDKYVGVLTLMDKRHYVKTVRSALATAKMTGRMYNSVGNSEEEFTVFVPRNDAQGVDLLPEGETELAEILKYHVLLEKVTSDQLLHNQTYETWHGEEITITRNGDVITINGTATMKLADLEGDNGVVHVIDEVLTH